MPSDRDAEQRPAAEQMLHDTGLRRAQQVGKLAYVVTGPAGEFLAWSETLPAMIGRKAAEMPTTTRAWVELLHPKDRERFRSTAIEAAKSGGSAELEYRLQHGPGQWIHIREVMEPLDPELNGSGGRRWLNTLQDISSAKKAARELYATKEYYRATFEQAAVGIVHSSLEGKVRLVNRAFCTMSGYSHAEARQLHIRDITHPEDLDPSIKGRRNLLERSGAPYQRELRVLHKNGSYLWVNVTTSLVRARDGTPRHFVSVLSDITARKRAEEEVNRFRAAMDVTLDSIFLTDPKTMRFLYVNDTACRRLGYTREQLLLKAPFELLGKTREQLRREDDEVIAAGERGTRTETRYVRSDGSGGTTELYRRAVATEGGGIVIVSTARDITERKAQEERIERLSRVQAMLSGIYASIVRIRDRGELFRESCRIAQEAGGFDAVSIRLIDEQSLAAQPVAWHGHDESVQWLRQVRFSLQDDSSGHSLLLEMMRTRKPAVTNDALEDPRVPFKEEMAEFGINSAAFLPLIVAEKIIGVMAMYSPVKGHFDEAEVKLLSELAADISFALEHLEKSERAEYLALYDELTGLANRRLLAERLGQLVQTVGRAQGKLALALLDIERLRSVNKSLGRPAGDSLLRQVGERLVRTAGTAAAARIAPDQFAVVLATVSDRSDAERVIAALARACFDEPYAVGGAELKVGAKTGVALFPNDGADSETLLVNAEAALRKAKQSGERHVFYTPDLSERTGAWLPLEVKLGRALEREELVLYYQPKVDTVTRIIKGLEALMRWQNPDLGLVHPAKFIPLMEETGMILEAGAWALQRAALDHRKWTQQGLKPMRVAVNVSAIQLRQRNFVQAVEGAIRQGITPTRIDLEITESLVMENVEDNIRKLNELREHGVQVAIDDFGTGYSSLGYLAKLPIQALKIDRTFITAMLKDPASMTLVQTIISLAHTLSLEVIAEGVEEEEQAKYLHLLRCEQIQGYLISKPVPFDEMTRLLHASHEGETSQQ
jgi:PAS domain S-box-containing protein/diguanylate cyclase (GGDEF)-like protein